MNLTSIAPIVCGTDLSDQAQQTARVAAALARRLGVPLHLIHVQQVGAAPGPAGPERLAAASEALRQTGAVVEGHLVPGRPAEELTAYARRVGARLLLVSAVGEGEARRWLTGSVAERTAEAAPVPTLVVREAAPLEAWLRDERALRVCVGLDFTATSEAALRWVAALREIGRCEVTLAYVDWPPEEHQRLGLAGPATFGGNSPELQQLLERDVRAAARRFIGEEGVQVLVRANWGRVDVPLVEIASEVAADVIVVGTHQRQGLGRLGQASISRGTLRHAPMSVACVPVAAAAPLPGPRIRKCERVLVAVDLDEAHGFAAPHAYSIVHGGGSVLLFHNLLPSSQSRGALVALEWVFGEPVDPSQRQRAAEEQLRALAPPEAEARGIRTEVEVVGSPDVAQAICAAAERFGADVICIGSHTRPGLSAKVLGSVALSVLQQSRRPVLIVWPPTS